MLLTVKPCNKTELEKFLNEGFLPISKTCYFLNTVVFELLIKIFYELERNELCEKTHDLEKVYGKLSETDKKFIESQYINLKNELEKELNSTEKDRKANIIYCDLSEALILNKDIVTDFKYGMTVSEENSAFNNLVESQGIGYTIPHHIREKFFNKLLKRIKEKQTD